MSLIDFEHPDIFEAEVLRIARALWPQAEYDGSTMALNKERDGVFITEECIHLLEATAEKKKDKAIKDATKLVELYKFHQNIARDKPIQCWLVFRHEPTAEQRDATRAIQKPRNLNINCLSYQQFQSKLINAQQYLSARDGYRFGSIHDPRDGSANPSLEYVDLDILDSSNSFWGVDSIVNAIQNGSCFELVGDYGAGKSMTLREIYKKLRTKYLKSDTPKFPIYINLRDHQGQKDTAEILERHAKNIGFHPPHHLVRAWNTGYAYLILDGFDEITSLGIQGKWRKLREMRYRSMEAIRKFIDNKSEQSGIIIAGREHFFDNSLERKESLKTNTFTTLTLNDFTDDQIERYKRINNICCTVPKWMPSRPLLLGTLLLKGVLQKVQEQAITDPGIGWNTLLNEISEREARIEVGIDGATVRTIFERLATKARASADGMGLFSQDDIFNVFVEVCEYPPDEQALILLLRLPGLGIDSQAEGTRKFIDADLVDTCRAGDVARFISAPFSFSTDIFEEAIHSLHGIGLSVLTLQADESLTQKQFNSIIDYAHKKGNVEILKYDLLQLAVQSSFDITTGISLDGVVAGTLDLDFDTDLSLVTFKDCYFTKLLFSNETKSNKIPKFLRCYFGEVEGRVSLNDMPPESFHDCVVDSFSETAETTDKILQLGMAKGVMVMLSVLRKIYTQRGSGRLESALYRGLDSNNKRLVPDVIKMLATHGLIAFYTRKGAKIWLPVKDMQVRVSRLISTPNICGDPIIPIASSL